MAQPPAEVATKAGCRVSSDPAALVSEHSFRALSLALHAPERLAMGIAPGARGHLLSQPCSRLWRRDAGTLSRPEHRLVKASECLHDAVAAHRTSRNGSRRWSSGLFSRVRSARPGRAFGPPKPSRNTIESQGLGVLGPPFCNTFPVSRIPSDQQIGRPSGPTACA